MVILFISDFRHRFQQLGYVETSGKLVHACARTMTILRAMSHIDNYEINPLLISLYFTSKLGTHFEVERMPGVEPTTFEVAVELSGHTITNCIVDNCVMCIS